MMKNNTIGRRRFIQYSAAGIALATSANRAMGAEHITMEQSANSMDLSLTSETDVLVAGGGTAGTIAAIQAARAGAKTLLLERGTQLGGTTPHKVPLNDIREMLVKNGAIVPQL